VPRLFATAQKYALPLPHVAKILKRRGTLRSQVLQTYSELPHKNLQDTCTRQRVCSETLFMLCVRVCAELESSAYATVQVWVVSRSASWENVSCI
jgi:hypothetical protein